MRLCASLKLYPRKHSRGAWPCERGLGSVLQTKEHDFPPFRLLKPVLLPYSLLQHLRSSGGFYPFVLYCGTFEEIPFSPIAAYTVFAVTIQRQRRGHGSVVERGQRQRRPGETSPVFRRSSFTYLFSTYFYYSPDILFMDHRKQFILRQINSAALSYCCL